MELKDIGNLDAVHPRELIPELCRVFYRLGWVTGTGGGITIRKRDKIFITPSGVQKERIQPRDLFVVDTDGHIMQRPPPERPQKISSLTPLFLAIYNMRDAGAVIHSHSIYANMASILSPGNEIRISNQEMMKGIRKDSTGEFYRNDETLVIPIIENTPHEPDLTGSLIHTMKAFPDTCAVLVRSHGTYIWGKSWEEAKTTSESYDYLFELIVKMKGCGVDLMEQSH